MENTEFLSNDQGVIHFPNRVDKFVSSFNLATLLNRSRIRKSKGHSAKDIFISLLSLPFEGKDFFHDLANSDDSPYGKDAIYEFLKCETFNWQKLLLCLAIKTCRAL
jgi:hypothetical protein